MPKNKRPLKVFLCHSSGDKKAVRALYKRLSVEGWIDPWLDEEKLIPGQDWDLEIRQAIRDADAILVVLSHNSITKEGYVQKEIKRALDIAEEKPDGTIYIIPVRLEECDTPDRLQRWHWVDLFDSKGYNRLLTSLQKRADNLDLEVAVERKPSFNRLFNYFRERKETVFSTLGIVIALLALLFGDNIYGQFTGHSFFATKPIPTLNATATFTLMSQAITPSQTLDVIQPNKSPTVTITPKASITPTISPSPTPSKKETEKIAFVSDSEIYVMDIDGRNKTRLTNNASAISYYYPEWSPDGTKIAFLAGQNDTRGLYVVNKDGSNQKLLTEKIVLGPNTFSWSPDGKKIVYTPYPYDEGTLAIVSVDGGEIFNLGVTSYVGDVSWSPDGSKIAFGVRGDGLFLIDPDGKNETKVFDLSECKNSTANCHADDISWSADGSKLVFLRNTYPLDWELYLLHLDSMQVVQLTNNQNADMNPNFSPDGSQIAFVSTQQGGTLEIFLMNDDGSNIKKITNFMDRQYGAGNIQWLRDDVLFFSYKEQLNKVNLLTGEIEKIMDGYGVIAP